MLINIFGNLTYLGLILTGIYHARKRNDLLKQERAFKLYALAALVMLIVLGSHVTRGANWQLVLSGLNLAFVGVSMYLTGKHCDRLEGINR